MTTSERMYLSGKIRELARHVSRGSSTTMDFDSEEQFLRMLSLEVVPVPATNQPIRIKRKS